MEQLDVYMNGFLVGEYSRDSAGNNQFRYAPQWLRSPAKRSISLSIPLSIAPYKGKVVYNFFDNLLPDVREVRERVVARYQADSTEPFDILSKIGRDCIGAIQLLPSDSPPEDVQRITYKTLSEQRMAEILQGYRTQVPLGMLRDEDDFRISLAGAQEKTALLKYQGNWCLPQHSTPTTHILKLPIGEIKSHDRSIDMTHSVENEYLCLKLARGFGFAVPDCEIVSPMGVKALAVERFDRKFSPDKTWLMRLPQEDFCQIRKMSPARKYESDGGPGIREIMEDLRGSQNAIKDRDTFMRAQVLFWLLGATDGHAKNFSVFINTGDTYQLTPLYDIVSAFPAVTKKGLHYRDLKLAMSLKASKGRKNQIDMIYPRHFMATAKEVGFSENRMQAILAEFAQTSEQVMLDVQKSLPKEFPTDVKDAVYTGMLRLLERLR